MDNKNTKLVNIKRRKLYLWISLAYWILWIIIDASTFPGSLGVSIVNDAWRVIYVLGVNYIFLEYTVPFIRRRKSIVVQVILFLFTFWIQCMLVSFGLFAWRTIGVGMQIYTPLGKSGSIMEDISHNAGFGMFSIIFYAVARHIYNYVKLKQATQQLRIEKQEAELNYLKSQTNPHFLFNTLNNIYSLSRDKSDLAPESIMRLSKILRFMLYETSGEYICIEQELKIITDYIELEKLRYDDSLHINFNHNIEDMKQAVPPLLLMPLVENAFKHGVSETRNRPFVDIHLSVIKRQLIFMVKNSSETLGEEPAVKENIGLGNLRRQLELLYKDYSLDVTQSASVFTATLKINLSSHV